MTMVNMLQAKTDLSKLVKMLEDKDDDCIMICRSGKPVATLQLFRTEKRLFGHKRGAVPFYGDFDEQNAEIAELFGMN